MRAKASSGSKAARPSAHSSWKAAGANGVPARPLSEAARRALLSHRWPGNVRELENAMHRAVLLATDLAPVFDVPVGISAVLGKATMSVAQLLKLGAGSVLELDRKVGEAIDIYVNNRLVARGEVVVVDDRLGVTMTEIIKSEDQAA